MSVTRPAPLAAKAEVPTAQIAKAALKRLAAERLEPTPENYERAFRQEAGELPESTDALAILIERIVRGIERGGQSNAANSGAASWTGIGGVAGFWAVVLIRQGRHGKQSKVHWRNA